MSVKPGVRCSKKLIHLLPCCDSPFTFLSRSMPSPDCMASISELWIEVSFCTGLKITGLNFLTGPNKLPWFGSDGISDLCNSGFFVSGGHVVSVGVCLAEVSGNLLIGVASSEEDSMGLMWADICVEGWILLFKGCESRDLVLSSPCRVPFSTLLILSELAGFSATWLR